MSETPLDLSYFMPGNPEDVHEVEVAISRRIRDEDGNPVLFKLRPISTQRIEEIEDECKKSIVKKNRVVGKELDQSRFLARIAVETTVYPDFKAQELRKAYQTEDPVEVAKKVLHIAGEYSTWIEKVSEINGFDDTAEDLEEYAKN